MNFDPELTEKFETDGTTFEYNHARCEYLSEQILEQYESRIKVMGAKWRKSKSKGKRGLKTALNILALHNEWNVEGNDETLYLVFNDEDECFTDVTTENEYYANPVTKEEE
tara:strand:- start:341 stop:673 length:333 start_codon:yes stop_codon:yes gene_type:complete